MTTRIVLTKDLSCRILKYCGKDYVSLEDWVRLLAENDIEILIAVGGSGK